MCYRIFLILSLSCVDALVLAGDALDQWQWRNPSPAGNSLASVVFARNVFLASGDSGLVLRSSDGSVWLPSNTGATNNPQALAAGNDVFVLVGDGGTILTSSDGVSWTAQSSGTTNW